MIGNKHYEDDMIYITHLTRNILSLIGVWPSYNKKKSIGEKICRYFLILICHIFLYYNIIPGMFFWIIEKRTRIRIQTIPVILFCIMAYGKYSNLLLHEKNIRRCLKHIEEDYRKLTNVTERHTMIASAKIGRRLITFCVILMYSSGISFRLILPLARGKIVTPQNVTIKPLPCPANFIFFDTQVSPVYELIFTIQVLSGIIPFSITAGLCGLATVFVMHACGQLKILMNLLKNLVEEEWQEKREVDKKLARIVIHQIRIRSFLQLVENTLQQACLIELMGCMILICIGGYIIIMEWENNNSIAICSCIVSLISMLINMFIFCYTGEQLTVQAEEVARKSCVLEWYRLPDKNARGIVLIIIMSNLPIKITAGKIMDLSFKTYGNVVKTAVTYFNLIRKMID